MCTVTMKIVPFGIDCMFVWHLAIVCKLDAFWLNDNLLYRYCLFDNINVVVMV